MVFALSELVEHFHCLFLSPLMVAMGSIYMCESIIYLVAWPWCWRGRNPIFLPVPDIYSISSHHLNGHDRTCGMVMERKRKNQFFQSQGQQRIGFELLKQIGFGVFTHWWIAHSRRWCNSIGCVLVVLELLNLKRRVVDAGSDDRLCCCCQWDWGCCLMWRFYRNGLCWIGFQHHGDDIFTRPSRYWLLSLNKVITIKIKIVTGKRKTVFVLIGRLISYPSSHFNLSFFVFGFWFRIWKEHIIVTWLSVSVNETRAIFVSWKILKWSHLLSVHKCWMLWYLVG